MVGHRHEVDRRTSGRWGKAGERPEERAFATVKVTRTEVRNAADAVDGRRRYRMASYLLKWRLLARTAPYAGAVLLIKLGLTYGVSFEGLIALPEIRIIFTSASF